MALGELAHVVVKQTSLAMRAVDFAFNEVPLAGAVTSWKWRRRIESVSFARLTCAFCTCQSFCCNHGASFSRRPCGLTRKSC